MVIYNTFSKRNNPKKYDVFEYEIFSSRFRGQVTHILGNTLTQDYNSWREIHKSICEEFGRYYLLPPSKYMNDEATKEDILSHILTTEDTIELLDSIDLSFQKIYNLVNYYKEKGHKYYQSYESAIEDLNTRFLEHGLGYQFNYGELFRIDNTHTHKEIILPAIRLIIDENFKGTEQEFFNAFEYYKINQYESAITEAGKAFESTMKTICDKMGFQYQKSDTANPLLTILKNKDFFKPMLESQIVDMNHLIGSLKAPATIRNNSGAHGQGSNIRIISHELVQLTLNLAASNILFLIQTYKAHSR